MILQNGFHKYDEYSPSEDTFFLDDFIKTESGDAALDVGSGSGYLTKVLEKSFRFVIGTDVNFHVLKNQTYKIQNPICCNAADPLRIKFDLIICNLPYLATDEILDIATDGGKEGVEIPIKIIHSVKNCLKKEGKFLFVTSSLSNYEKLMNLANEGGFTTKIIGRKKLFFEEILVIEAKLSL